MMLKRLLLLAIAPLLAAEPLWPAAAQPDVDEALRDYIAVLERRYPIREARVEAPRKVTARKGAVHITLRIANTKLRPHGEHYGLWLSATLKNVGKKPFELWTEKSFRYLGSLEKRTGLHYELRDDAGKPIFLARLSPPTAPEECGAEPSDPWYDANKPPIKLAPGQSISTPATRDLTSLEARCLKRPILSPIPPYGELYPFDLRRFKKVQIRLVYANTIPESFEGADRPEPHEVRVATDWITLEVLP